MKKPTLLSRNTAWASAASFVQFGLTAVVLVLLTYEFEPRRLGEFIAALSLTFFVAPFAALGAPSLLQKRHGAEGETLETALARARGMALVGGPAWCALVVLAAMVILPDVDLSLVLLLAIAELVAVAYIDTMQAVVQSTETLELSVIMKAAQSGFRLIAVVVLLVVYEGPTIGDWALLYLISACAAAVVAHVVVGRHVQHRLRVRLPTLSDAKEGLGLTLGWGTGRLRSDADKVLLVRLGFGADAGLYATAYRVLQIVYVPIRGAIAASIAQFWQGSNTPGASIRLARRLTRTAGLYGLAAGVALALASPLIPFVLGDGYDDTSTVLLWLTPFPLLMALQAFPATALTADGFNRRRIELVLAATIGNVALNLVFIPEWGWRGAVVATLITEIVLTMMFWVTLMRREADRSVIGVPRS